VTNRVIFLATDAENAVLVVVFVFEEMKNQTKPYFLSWDNLEEK
jgi:hypothetical protein